MGVKKKNNESSEVLLRRFNREVQVSGILTDVKKRRYFEKGESRKKKRDSAIRKARRKMSKRGY